MTDWLRIVLVAALSLASSIGGVLVAIFITDCKDDALRGGAIGTALALIFMFIARNYGMKLYDEAKNLAAMEGSQPSITLEELSQRIETLRAAIVLDGDELKTLNWFLIGTTAIAAVVCAFGDKIASHFITNPGCH